MKLALAAVLILLSGSVTLAVVGGGDVTLKNKERDINSSRYQFHSNDNGSGE